MTHRLPAVVEFPPWAAIACPPTMLKQLNANTILITVLFINIRVGHDDAWLIQEHPPFIILKKKSGEGITDYLPFSVL
jgi:hypothetical protein